MASISVRTSGNLPRLAGSISSAPNGKNHPGGRACEAFGGGWCAADGGWQWRTQWGGCSERSYRWVMLEKGLWSDQSSGKLIEQTGKIHFNFHGTTHELSTGPFSIAVFNYQRVNVWVPTFDYHIFQAVWHFPHEGPQKFVSGTLCARPLCPGPWELCEDELRSL